MARARQFSVSGQDSEDDMDVSNARTRRGNTDVGLAGSGNAHKSACSNLRYRQRRPISNHEKTSNGNRHEDCV